MPISSMMRFSCWMSKGVGGGRVRGGCGLRSNTGTNITGLIHEQNTLATKKNIGNGYKYLLNDG